MNELTKSPVGDNGDNPSKPKTGELVSNNNEYLDLWEKLPRESWRDYDWFCKYKDLNPVDRKISILAKVIDKPISVITNIACKNNWDARIRAWHQEIDRIALIEKAEERRELEKYYKKVARKFTEKAVEKLETIDVDELNAKDLVAFVKMAHEIEDRVTQASYQNNQNISKVEIKHIPPKNEVNVNIQSNSQTNNIENIDKKLTVEQSLQDNRDQLEEELKYIEAKEVIPIQTEHEKEDVKIETNVSIKIEPNKIVLDASASELACKLLEQLYKPKNNNGKSG